MRHLLLSLVAVGMLAVLTTPALADHRGYYAGCDDFYPTYSFYPRYYHRSYYYPSHHISYGHFGGHHGYYGRRHAYYGGHHGYYGGPNGFSFGGRNFSFSFGY